MTTDRWLPLRPALLAGLVVALACIPGSAPAQDSVMTASLLKRLGSAVDGYRTGLPVWVVASTEFPNDVVGVFPSAERARAAMLRAGGSNHVFGPYVAPPDNGLRTIVFSLPCKKNLDTSCQPARDSLPDDSTGAGIRPTEIDSIRSITVTVLKKNGRVMSVTVPPEEAEAFFLTMSAVDRFLIPYYTQLYGASVAADLREQYLQRFMLPAH